MMSALAARRQTLPGIVGLRSFEGRSKHGADGPATSEDFDATAWPESMFEKGGHNRDKQEWCRDKVGTTASKE